MTLYRLAHLLHQPLYVIEEMTFEEISGWIAYFKIEKRDHGHHRPARH